MQSSQVHKNALTRIINGPHITGGKFNPTFTHAHCRQPEVPMDPKWSLLLIFSELTTRSLKFKASHGDIFLQATANALSSSFSCLLQAGMLNQKILIPPYL